MKKGWQIRTLGDVCVFDKAQGIHRSLPYVGLEHIESDTGRFIGSTDPQPVKSSTFRFSDQHVLYGRLRPYLNKAIAPDFEGHCSTEIFPLKPSRELLREYLLYWLLAAETCELINATCTGARMPRAQMDAVMSFDFPLPPLAEQQRIVGLLGDAFAGLAAARANAEKNRQNACALFESHLTDALGRDCKTWPSRQLDSLLIDDRKISYGIIKPGFHDPNGVRLIKSQQVRDNSMDLNEDFRITKTLDREYARTRLQGGEILLNLVGASIGRSAVAPPELRGANVSRAIAVIPVRPEITHWVQYNLRCSVGQSMIHQKTGGAAQPVLNLSEVKSMVIPFPPLAKQREIVHSLDSMGEHTQRLARTYERKLAALDALKKSLLHQAFTGNL